MAGGLFHYKGNINLYNRPKVRNSDGTISTVRSMSYNRDGKEVLIPTVSDEGKIMDDIEAIDYWEKKGKNLGVYNSIEEADSAARQIHLQQEELLNRRNNNMTDMEFDLSEVVSDATKAQADRDFYLAMATQSKVVSPIAAYLAGAAGAKAASLTGKLQARKDAQTAAEKFTKRRDNLVLNMHAVARDKNINPATKAGMIGLIAREIGLQPKDYDAENNVLNVADTDGNMMTFDFNEKLDEKNALNLRKLLAQARGAEALAGKREYDLKKSLSGESGKGTKQTKIKITDIKNDPRFKNVLQDTADSYTSDITESLSDLNEAARRDLYNMLNEGEDKVRIAYGTVYKALQDEFGGRFGNKEPQSTIEEKVNLTDIWSNM